jgi:hypothetical protein
LETRIFNEVLKIWVGGNISWTKELANKYGYVSGEALRQAFKRQRKALGITKDNLNIPIKVVTNTAKILCLDIETTPISALVWSLWQDNIGPEAILQDWHILSWSAKWLFNSDILSDCLTSEEVIKHDDSRILKSIWNLLEEADIVISHNGNNFDIKRLNTRFLYNELIPPTPYQSVDTLVIAKNTFDFSSRKLDYINQYLGLPAKQPTGFELWKRCFLGDPEALNIMERYNRNDVEILEDLYLKLRPYIKGHPNLNLWSTENVSVCPNCASKDLDWSIKEYYTYTGVYRGFRCLNCGANGRSRQLDIDRDKRKLIVR